MRTSESKLQKAMTAAEQSATEARTRLDAIVRAIDATPSLSPKLREEARGLEKRLGEITRSLGGDTVMRARQKATPESMNTKSHPMSWLWRFPSCGV